MEMTKVVLLTFLAALLAGGTQAIGLDQAINDTIKNIQSLTDKISDLQDTFTSLARQTMSQQLFIEERIRSEGSSGIKQVRVYQHGTSSYFDFTHVGKGVSAIHDHSNSNDTLGMGETVVVINGVEFRTRHNDYRLVQPDESTTAFRAVVNIAPPDVPPEVLNKSTPELQIAEMIQWFKAFKTQNPSLRNYKPYFRPVMCYMEAAWTLDKSIVEPFASDRHNLVADSWIQLQQQIRYTGYTGNKDLRENYSFLPTTIISINDTNGRPLYAQWNYRILCKPFSGDVPTKYFRLQDDLSNRESYRFTVARVPELRVARYRLSESDFERFMGFTLLDKIMQEIPGVDNKPPFLNEAAFNQDVYSQEFANYTKLNTGYYHRMFKTGATNAMGLSAVVRGFSDEMLFVAETTQPLIAPVDITICATASSCTTKSSRFTYAIPLEIVYLTPLQTWNPYNLSVTENLSIPTKNGRTGSLTIKEKAFNGTATKVYHYLTPASFYSSSTGEFDPADTTNGAVGVLDQAGNIRAVTASGIQVVSLPIKGIGTVRLRYPIPPVHGEGSTVWKELSLVKTKLYQLQGTGTSSSNPAYQMQLYPTTVTGLHYHDFTVFKQDYDSIMNGITVSTATSQANGHTHNLDLWYNTTSKVIEYKACDYLDLCWDGHPKNIKLVTGP